MSNPDPNAVELLHRRHFAGNPEALAELETARTEAREEQRVYREAEALLSHLPPHAFRLGDPERDDDPTDPGWIVPLFTTDETPPGIYWPSVDGDVGMFHLMDDGFRAYEFAHEDAWHCLRGANGKGAAENA